jgi:hypothetical protein
MSKGLFFLFSLLFVTAASWGQTSADLDRKYRKVTSYELKPGIVMIPKYAEDGNVCEMSVESHPASGILGATFSDEEVTNIINELVPEPQRGRDLKTGKYDKWLNTMISSGVADTEYYYENISIHVYSATRVEQSGDEQSLVPSGNVLIVIKWLKRACK